jgi:hypothetical protein
VEVLRLLSDLPVIDLVRRSSVVYPLVNAAHVAAIGLLLGSIATLDLRLLGLFRTVPLAHLAPPLTRVAACGLLAAAMTGGVLFLTRPFTYLENPAFLLKLGIVGLALANILALRVNPSWRRAVEGGAVSAAVRGAALVSMLAWLGAVLAGRWIGFLQ